MKFKNIPNILSISRFVLTIVLIILMGINFSYNPIIGNTNFKMIDLVCCIIFIVASFTDFLDGKIARKYHLVSNFGKFIDPLADKALVNSSLILLACYKSQYSFFLGIVVALTEVILMPLGHGWMWIGWGGGILFFVSILFVNFGVRVVGYGIDAHTATQLNEQIRKRKLEKCKKDDISNDKN